MIYAFAVVTLILVWSVAYSLGRWRGELDSADVVAHLRKQIDEPGKGRKP